jgi:23S rRNA pseudouridine2605 synthase
MNNIHKNYWNTHQRSVKEKPHGVARVISKRGFCSRSQAENLVRAGRVSLRGKIVRDPDAPARENDEICVDGKIVKASEFVYFMMNKPRGYVTTASDEKGRATVMDLFREEFAKMFPGKPVPHISPVGRLDAASEGLLLFTNDTKWADTLLKTKDERRQLQKARAATNHVWHGRAAQFVQEHRDCTKTKDAIRSKVTEHAEVPRIGNEPLAFPHTKIYRVQVNGHPTSDDLAKMESGFYVPPRVFGEPEEFMHAVSANLYSAGEKNSWLEITLDEGKNREIRRMLAHLGYEVLRLVRIKFCNYELGDLKQGEIKEIRPSTEQTTV